MVKKTAAPKKRDTRLVVGIALVVAGVAGTLGVVWSMDATTPYLVTTRDILPGETVSAEDLTTIDLHVRQGSLPYLTADHQLTTVGQVALTPLSSGSLVASNALTDQLASDTTTVTVSLGIGGAPWLVPGARVDVWVSPAASDGQFGPPRVVARGAVVAGVRTDEGFAVDPSVVSVDIRVVYRDVALILDAVANGFPLSLSPVLMVGER